jgi:hypothetical protein
MENTKEFTIETTIANINFKIKELENDVEKARKECDESYKIYKHLDKIHSGLEKELAKAYDEFCDARNKNDLVMMGVYELKMFAIDKECCRFRKEIENNENGFFSKQKAYENKLKELADLDDELKFINSMAKKNLEIEEKLIKNKIRRNKIYDKIKECDNSDEMKKLWEAYFKYDEEMEDLNEMLY